MNILLSVLYRIDGKKQHYDSLVPLVKSFKRNFLDNLEDVDDFILFKNQDKSFSKYHLAFTDVFKRTHDLWKQGHNIFYSDLDNFCTKKTKIFGEFDEFRLFSLADQLTRASETIPIYFLSSTRYFPNTMDKNLWKIGRKYHNNFEKYSIDDHSQWDFDQVGYNHMFFAQPEVAKNPRFFINQGLGWYDYNNLNRDDIYIIRLNCSKEMEKTKLEMEKMKDRFNQLKGDVMNDEVRAQRLSTTFTSFGNRILQHPKELDDLQKFGIFTPIMVELAPTEACDSDCPFCSVANRPIKNYMPFHKIKKVLEEFKLLGTKSIEITGGGNPMLYRDRETGETINDIVRCCITLGFDIGIITNSHSLKKLDKELHQHINWIRISLIQLDEGKPPEDYDFNGFPYHKMGFSYILHESGGQPDVYSKTKRVYPNECFESIRKVNKLLELHPDIKFVRFNPNCIVKSNHTMVRDKYQKFIKSIDRADKMFIKDVSGGNKSPRGDGVLEDYPLDSSCLIGGFRPYIASNKNGTSHNVYICNSFVMEDRTYSDDFSLCDVKNVIPTWKKLQENYNKNGYPYEVRGNRGCGWLDTCYYCFFRPANEILEQVTVPLTDRNFI